MDGVLYNPRGRSSCYGKLVTKNGPWCLMEWENPNPTPSVILNKIWHEDYLVIAVTRTSKEDQTLLANFLIKDKKATEVDWQTFEANPREVKLYGRSAMDPDIIIAQIDGFNTWILACGSTFDGRIVGQDIYIRSKPRSRH